MTMKYNATPGLPTGQVLEILESPRWVRVVFNGQTIANSRRVLLLRERNQMPVYYFPREDVDDQWLKRTDHTTTCPYKGQASYWTIKAGDRESENAVWSYTHPLPACEQIKDYRAFYWDQVDHWYEEEEEVFKHPRDPFKRVDAIPSSRHVKIYLGGTLLADSHRPVLVFETGMPTRYYLPREDVRMEYLTPTNTHTVCPYKGTASYWSATVNDEVHPDIVWGYPQPIPEIPKIRQLLCFYHEKVDQLVVDGTPVEK